MYIKGPVCALSSVSHTNKALFKVWIVQSEQQQFNSEVLCEESCVKLRNVNTSLMTHTRTHTHVRSNYMSY